jgi:hypothetical protein
MVAGDEVWAGKTYLGYRSSKKGMKCAVETTHALSIGTAAGWYGQAKNGGVNIETRDLTSRGQVPQPD